MKKKKTPAGRSRVSRRSFLSMWPMVLAPAAWVALNRLGSLVDRSLEYLCSRRVDGGRFGAHANVGDTALVTMAVLRGDEGSRDPMAISALDYLTQSIHPDGGIYTPGRRLETYETCLAALCFAEANTDRRYDDVLRDAVAFARTCQWEESRGRGLSDVTYGGAACGWGRWPDLLNTALLLDIFHCCGVPPDDHSVRKAVVFVTRCQNAQVVKDASQNDKGGFRPCAAEAHPGSGAMTMNGLRGLLHGGVERGDARLEAAVAWIRKNYDLASNPGMGSAGLYHYYHFFAKTLLTLGIDEIEDADGTKHKWRNELCGELLRRQRKDGSWCNQHGHWMENDPQIATAHALLALSYCREPMGTVA